MDSPAVDRADRGGVTIGAIGNPSRPAAFSYREPDSGPPRDMARGARPVAPGWFISPPGAVLPISHRGHRQPRRRSGPALPQTAQAARYGATPPPDSPIPCRTARRGTGAGRGRRESTYKRPPLARAEVTAV